MPTVDHSNKELLLKLVYYGPGHSGKTTNLKYIHEKTKPEHRGTLLTLSAEAERTIFFEMLPVELGAFKGYSIRLHLCTVPGKVVHDRARRHILSDVDGIVFVVDSQRSALDANLESLANLAQNLRLHGLSSQQTPLVVQYNKRDHADAMALDELRFTVGGRCGEPAHSLLGQRLRLRQRHVAGTARAVRGSQVDGAHIMAVQALPHLRAADPHPRRPAGKVA